MNNQTCNFCHKTITSGHLESSTVDEKGKVETRAFFCSLNCLVFWMSVALVAGLSRENNFGGVVVINNGHEPGWFTFDDQKKFDAWLADAQRDSVKCAECGKEVKLYWAVPVEEMNAKNL